MFSSSRISFLWEGRFLSSFVVFFFSSDSPKSDNWVSSGWTYTGIRDGPGFWFWWPFQTVSFSPCVSFQKIQSYLYLVLAVVVVSKDATIKWLSSSSYSSWKEEVVIVLLREYKRTDKVAVYVYIYSSTKYVYVSSWRCRWAGDKSASSAMNVPRSLSWIHSTCFLSRYWTDEISISRTKSGF